MNPYKKTATAVGLLFIAATLAFMLGNGLIESALSSPNYLLDLYPNKNQVITGVLLEMINSAAVVGIAIMLFPVLKKHNEPIALGYVGFRVIESVVLLVGLISPLLLITLSQEHINASNQDTLYFQTLGVLAIRWYHLSFQVAMIALGAFSLVFCYLLYQSKLIPRSLSVLGFIGYVSLLISALLEIFEYNTGMVLFLPGAIFELMLPIWLIVKGFNIDIHAERRVLQP